MIPVTNLRSGTFFEEEGTPFEVLKYTHTKLGRGNANIKVKVRNLKSGATFEKTFVSGAKVSSAELEKREAQFLYEDKGECYFMDSASFEQFPLSKETLSEKRNFLKEGEKVEILFYDGYPLSVKLPLKMEFMVEEAPPEVRGNSATNIFKEVILENGITVKVPLFIKKGDKIVVDTRNGEYVKKLKGKRAKFKARA